MNHAPDNPRSPMVLWRQGWMSGSGIATLLVVAWLLWPPGQRSKPKHGLTPENTNAQVRLENGDEIIIPAGGAMEEKLKTVVVQPAEVNFALLRVTGSVIAKLTPGDKLAVERWQFSTDELSATYADWLRSQSEIENAERQLAKIKQITQSTVTRYKTVVERLRRLVASGTEARKDLNTAEADLEQAELQGERDVFTAESTLNLARRSRAALERQLQRSGLDPEVLTAPDATTMALVVGNVPESRMSVVKQDQSCEAQLFGAPGKTYTGHVEQISTTVSSDRRAMRVLFHLDDNANELKPGMFAEIGLGTDPRQAILIPPTAVLHVGSIDYALVAAGMDRWKITPCVIADAGNDLVEVVEGLKGGDRIITQGAILLKPFVVQAFDK